jgi:hypothetical protein
VKARRLPDAVIQQRRLADPSLTPHDQGPTLAPADIPDQPVQYRAFIGPTEQALASTRRG